MRMALSSITFLVTFDRTGTGVKVYRIMSESEIIFVGVGMGIPGLCVFLLRRCPMFLVLNVCCRSAALKSGILDLLISVFLL